MTQRFAFNTMTVGTCYYPEHWDEKLWAEDLTRMLDAGITVIRIAEFAWSIFEREEGVFTFDFFDRFLALCEHKGMQVIFGTPTATPPAWLTEKYPEVLNADPSGVLYRHGCRRHYNYNSPVYREKTALIVDQLARHYGQHPAIIGWQIDNELNCETADFHSEADSAAFRVFLREKYGTLDALNAAWGTVFWSQTYTDWSQVYVPRPVVSDGINPHLYLDYLRFVSASAVSYCALQAQILRRFVKPGVFITTNGLFGHLDNHRMTNECLDIYTYDSYPNFAYGLDTEGREDDLRDRWWSKTLTEVRSVCPHFGIMEQQSGAGSWYSRMDSPMPQPGQLTLWAMQSVAHGADFVSFFRWRTCTFGTEIYWHGILNYDNRDNRRLAEVKRFAAMMKKLAPIAGAENIASFAVVKDIDNVFDSEIDNWHRSVARASEDAVFAASQAAHIPCDHVYLREGTTLADLAKYPVLIMPHAVIMTEERAALLAQYAARGGTLVIGCRSAYKDEHGQCVMLPQPGLLQAISGTDVTEFTYLTPHLPKPGARWADGTPLEVPVFNDALTPLPGTKVLAVFTDAYYAGQAALTEHAHGQGRVLHLGSAFTRENTRQILQYLGVTDAFAEVVQAPETVELVMREKAGARYVFALNYQHAPVTVTLKRPVWSMLEERETEGAITLPAYGVQVWRV